MLCLLAALLAASMVARAGQQTTDGLAAALAAADTAAQREALLAADPDLVDTALVIALARLATNAAIAQDYRRSQSLHEYVVELAHRTGSRKEEGEALQNVGNALYFQRRFPEALAAYERRLAVERQRGDDAAVASALVAVATIRYSMAEYIDALERYRQALAIQERLADRATAASTLISTGNIRYLQGDYAGAIRDHSNSRDLYLAISDTDGHARALEGLARTFSAQGDYAAALSALAGVLAEGRARSDRSRQATALQSIADIHLRLGNLDAARGHYEQSRDHFLAIKNMSGAGRVWQGIGMAELIANRFAEAEHAYTTSAEICRGVADREGAAQAIVGLAFAQAAQEKFKEAIESYRKAIDAFVALGWREAAGRANVGLAQAFLGAGNVASSLETAELARHAAIALENDDLLWRALTAEAPALRRKGAADLAIGTARAAAGTVERMYRAAMEKPATSIPSDTTTAFTTLAILQAAAGNHRAAWESAAHMRTLALRSALALNERDIARGLTAEEREHEKSAATELQSLIAQTARERALPKPDATRLATLDRRLATVAATRTAWMEALYARLPELRIWRGAAPTPAHGDLLKFLNTNTALLEFVVDDEDVLVLLSERRGDRIETVSYLTSIRRRVLAERVSVLTQMAALKGAVRWRRVAGEVASLIPAAVATRLASASRVVVVPHDMLWRVPFEALPVGAGYLGERAQVVYAGSADAMMRVRPAAPAAPGRVLAVSAPALATDVAERVERMAPGWTLRAGESGDREVAAALKPYADGDKLVLREYTATELAVVARAADAAALHIAAPFRINSASPLFSPILLAGSAAAPEDNGALELREVMNLDLRCRAVILSDPAATSMRDGATAVNVVQWAWLAAGVPSIVMTRWAADATASEALLAEFHRRLASGADVEAALHGARGAIRKNPKWSDPYYWAGWMTAGF
jgi:CHAT domain-containing protein/tetratricopeptide (TPR) repeat protein